MSAFDQPAVVEHGTQLRWEDDDVVAGPDRVVQHRRLDLGHHGGQHLDRVGGPLVHDLPRTRRGERRHRRHAVGDAALGGERAPRHGALLVLGEAPRQLPGMPERRPVEPAGAHVEQVAQHQPDRPPDAHRRPVGPGQRRVGRRHAHRVADRAVDDEEDGAPAGRRGRPVDEQLGAAQRGDGGGHDREVDRQAAGHHRIDRHLLGGEQARLDRLDAEHVVGAEPRAGEHRRDTLRRRGDDRQPVGPAALAEQLLQLVVVGDIEPIGDHDEDRTGRSPLLSDAGGDGTSRPPAGRTPR